MGRIKTNTHLFHPPHQEKYEHLHPRLEEIACEHPEYGIPRITKELQDTYQIVLNHKVVQRLLRLWRLSLVRNIRAPKPSGIQKAIKTAGKRASWVSGRENISLFDVVYTDFTELVYADGTAKAHLMVILGHVCKMVFGWAYENLLILNDAIVNITFIPK